MRNQGHLIKLSSAVLLAISTQAFAGKGLVVTHQIISVNQYDSKTELNIEITVKNTGDVDLNQIVLEPVSGEFIGNPKKLAIKLPTLPVGGTINATWQVSSLMTPIYFHPSPVIAFNVSAQTHANTPLAFSAYSEP